MWWMATIVQRTRGMSINWSCLVGPAAVAATTAQISGVRRAIRVNFCDDKK